jgi:hypothetical protein
MDSSPTCVACPCIICDRSPPSAYSCTDQERATRTGINAYHDRAREYHDNVELVVFKEGVDVADDVWVAMAFTGANEHEHTWSDS